MDTTVRNAIQRATQAARTLLETEYAEQLEGTFDVHRDGTIPERPGAHLDEARRVLRGKILAAVEHRLASGLEPREAVAAYLREASFTTLNRFVALKMLEARSLVQECVSRGEQSSGFQEFTGLAPGLAQLPDRGYRLYIESLFDEIGLEVRVLFDRREPASLLWPRRPALSTLLEILNQPELGGVWQEDETVGWVYQYFNSQDERRAMRDASQAPRNSRELAVRNQFFTPRYVVKFLTDNTLGRTWIEMHGGESSLRTRCEYFVSKEGDGDGTQQSPPRPKKDPRDILVLDPACGSGHFLLYAFDLLLEMYLEAWSDPTEPRSKSGRTLRQDYQDLASLKRALPALIVEHNLHGVDIDPRAAQIAALALWMRAQRAYKDFGIQPAERQPVRRTRVVVAEQVPGDEALIEGFAGKVDPPLLRDLFLKMLRAMRLAGELGPLLRVEALLADDICRARQAFLVRRQATANYLPGLAPDTVQGEIDLSGIDDDRFFAEAEERLLRALARFADSASGGPGVRRRLFADDSAHGLALIEILRKRFDVVLMNPPFGAGSLLAKRELEKAYPRTKNDLYAAFVERGVELLQPRGLLGAITSRTGFFLSSFQKWREEILLKEAPPVVFADLGYGVLDSAMVEVAAYCLEKASA